MQFKSSRYNFLVTESDYNIAFNSKNCALVKVNEDFIKILNDPNQEFSEEEKNLRENMFKAGFLVDSQVDEIKLLEFKYLKSKFESDTLTITIMPTDACNFSCFYCFENKKNLKMSQKIVDSTIEFVEKRLKNFSKLKICWFGGEPLLATDIVRQMSKKLIEIAAVNNCEYSAFMVTNGYLLNPEIINELKDYKIDTLQITIDGDEESHNRRRCTKEGVATFEKIIENLKILTANNFKIACRVNIDKSNISSIKPLIKKLAVEFGDKKDDLNISFGQILPIANQDKWDTSVCLSLPEYIKCVDDFTSCMIEEHFMIKNQYPFYPTPKVNFCGAVQMNSFVIRPSGLIDKCWDCETTSVGDVFKGIAHDGKTEQNLSKWILHNPFADSECRACKILPVCFGGCPYFSIERKEKMCLKWRFDIENIIRKKYLRHLQGR